jgi:sugar lactone lactonase YvrE
MNFMKTFSIAAIACGLFFLTSCGGVKKEGLVIMTDPSYKATMFATTKAGFGSPDGLLWHKGKLYLADEGGIALESFSRGEGVKKLADAGFGFLSPEDLVIDAQDNIFFTDDDAGGLWEVTSDGKPRLVVGKDKGLISTEGIAMAPDGSFLVGDGKQHIVFRVTRDGQVTEFLGKDYGITKAESMVFDDRGNLYIADNEDNVLYLLDADRKLRRIIDRGDSFTPETIYFAKGSLYITDSRNGKLYVYAPGEEPKTIAAFGGQLKDVEGVTVDERGHIFVSIQTNLKQKQGDIVEISREETQIAKK